MPQGNIPLGPAYMWSVKIKAELHWQNVSALRELGIVSAEFSFHAPSVIPAAWPLKTSGTSFSKHTFSLLASSWAWGFVMLA